MKFLIAASRHSVLIMILVSGVLYGCATGGPVVGADQLTVDKISSDEANIGAVYVRKTAVGIDITGKVKFTKAMIGTPPGGVVITIIDPTGKVLYTSHTGYYRYGKPVKPSATFRFSLTIPLVAPAGSIVRLVTEAAS
jgi:hypothetical protein